VGGLIEEMRVRIEGDARTGVAKDAAHVRDVELQIDDQVAREGVASQLQGTLSLDGIRREPG
jgi:hypothetical protein